MGRSWNSRLREWFRVSPRVHCMITDSLHQRSSSPGLYRKWVRVRERCYLPKHQSYVWSTTDSRTLSLSPLCVWLVFFIYQIFLYDATCTVLSAVSKLVEQVIKTLTRDRNTSQLTTHGTKHTAYSSLHTRAHHTSIAENTLIEHKWYINLTCVLSI